MFARRHPYLFALLILSAIGAATVIVLSLAVMHTADESEYASLDGNRGAEKVGVVELTGIITDAREIVRQIRRFGEDDAIRAIVVRVDSPGGVVGPSQEIYREIRKTRERKKIVASMGAVAASGGYYAVAGADAIFANPGTITGSIGVIMEYTNFRALFQKIGLTPVVIKSGEFKDTGSPVRDMTPEEERMLKDFVDELHRQFVAAIAEGRQMDYDVVARLADGRIYTGQAAQELGLVDQIGNLQDAIAWAGREAGIEGEIDAVYIPEKKLSLLRSLLESVMQDTLARLARPQMRAGYIFAPSQD
jgi:protease-4